MSDAQDIAIFGAGGFAREVAWLFSSYEQRGVFKVVGFVDDEKWPEPRVLNGKPILTLDQLEERHPKALLSVAVGNPKAREALVTRGRSRGHQFVSIWHHTVEVSEFVVVGEGSIICCGAILTVNIDIGAHVHINLDCTIGHDVVIGDFATIAPGAHISGNVHIGRGAYIGTGATIINGTSKQPIVVGEGCVVAAGACITSSTEPNTLYAGVPAVLKKKYE
jgi:sugar O-acyltransferase (sialic acid O-acetyltransferase NeuD family)